MLRDDAIRAGLLKPTQEDIKRMNLAEGDLSEEARLEMALEEKTKAELVVYAKEEYGLELDKDSRKTELIEKIKAIFR